MTPNERLALRHLIKLCLSTTSMEEVIHRERLRQAEAAVEADRAAEQQKIDEAKAYVEGWDARRRKLNEQAAAILQASQAVCGNCAYENYCRTTDRCFAHGTSLSELYAKALGRSVGGN